jgi:hypothetical protein
VKTGKGFFDCSDRSATEVIRKRERMLFKVFKATKGLIEERT